jgi:hypothetical protein
MAEHPVIDVREVHKTYGSGATEVGVAWGQSVRRPR